MQPAKLRMLYPETLRERIQRRLRMWEPLWARLFHRADLRRRERILRGPMWRYRNRQAMRKVDWDRPLRMERFRRRLVFRQARKFPRAPVV